MTHYLYFKNTQNLCPLHTAYTAHTRFCALVDTVCSAQYWCFVDVGDVFLHALHNEQSLSASIDHAVPHGDRVIVSYHVYTPLMEKRRFFDIPLLNLRVGLKSAISRTTPGSKGAVDAAKCVSVLVLLIFHFELINIVGLIGVGRETQGSVCGVAVSSLRVLAEPPASIYRGILAFGMLTAAARDRVLRGHQF